MNEYRAEHSGFMKGKTVLGEEDGTEPQLWEPRSKTKSLLHDPSEEIFL